MEEQSSSVAARKRHNRVSMRRLSMFMISVLLYLFPGRRVQFDGIPIIDGLRPKLFSLGKITIGTKCVFRSFRLRQQVTALEGGTLQIGPNSFFNDGVTICASTRIQIGHSCKIGDMVYIYDTDFHSVSPDTTIGRKAVTIGNNVWIGTNSMILAGTTIGDHAVIAAGSIVTGEIPPKSLAAGNPARVIKSFECSDDWVRP